MFNSGSGKRMVGALGRIKRISRQLMPHWSTVEFKDGAGEDSA